MSNNRFVSALSIALVFLISTNFAYASCRHLPSFNELDSALEAVVTAGNNAGLGNDMWATVVDRDGTVCAVARSGNSPGDQWPGSRVISAQKANTANAFSLPANGIGFSAPLSTANLYAAVQPGGSLFGLQESNPVNAKIAYRGNAKQWGTAADFLVNKRIGGVNVFGGGLALYNSDGELIGAIGLSGDTSCTDHIIAWKIRDMLELDNIPGGVAAGTDNIIFDNTMAVPGIFQSASGFGHPECGFNERPMADNLPINFPIGPNL